MPGKLATFSSTALFVLILVYGHDMASYLVASATRVGDSMRDQIPLELEVARAKQMVRALDSKIDAARRSIARDEVDAACLAEEVENLTKAVEAGHLELISFERAVKEGNPAGFGLRGEDLAGATKTLEDRRQSHQAQEATLAELTKALEIRQKLVEASRSRLRTTIASQKKLAADIVGLEARQQQNQATQSQHGFGSTEDLLAKTRELVQGIEARVRVEERLLLVDKRTFDATRIWGETTPPLADGSLSRR